EHALPGSLAGVPEPIGDDDLDADHDRPDRAGPATDPDFAVARPEPAADLAARRRPVRADRAVLRAGLCPVHAPGGPRLAPARQRSAPLARRRIARDA